MDVRNLMRRSAGFFRDREAVVADGRRLSFGEAWERGLRLANGLLAQGLVFMFIAGMPMAAVFLLPKGLIADIADYAPWSQANAGRRCSTRRRASLRRRPSRCRRCC